MSNSQSQCDVCGREIFYPNSVLPPDMCGECYGAALKWAARMARAGLVGDLGESYPAFYSPDRPASSAAVFGPPPLTGVEETTPDAVVEKSP
jgi:hypothetical protein